MYNVGGHPYHHPYGDRENSLMEVFFFDGDCLGRVSCPRKEMVVVKMVIGMFWREVLTNLGVLMEVVILVLLMVRG